MILSDSELSIVYERASELVNDGWTKSFCAFNRAEKKAYREKDLYDLPNLENTSFCAYGALVYAAREKQILMSEKGGDLDALLVPLIDYLKENETTFDYTAYKRPLNLVGNWNDSPENSSQHVADSLMHISRNLQPTATGDRE